MTEYIFGGIALWNISKLLTIPILRKQLKRVAAASARLPASLHAKLPAPLQTRNAKTNPAKETNNSRRFLIAGVPNLGVPAVFLE
jgi:hypothetical protein